MQQDLVRGLKSFGGCDGHCGLLRIWQFLPHVDVGRRTIVFLASLAGAAMLAAMWVDTTLAAVVGRRHHAAYNAREGDGRTLVRRHPSCRGARMRRRRARPRLRQVRCRRHDAHGRGGGVVRGHPKHGAVRRHPCHARKIEDRLPSPLSTAGRTRRGRPGLLGRLP